MWSRSITVLALLVVLIPGVAVARADGQPRLDPKVARLYEQYPVIELVTMGVGALIWERHGHIALCVRYRDPRQDRCYNYGMGSFSEPLSMGWGFFSGNKSFWVEKMDPGLMMAIYRRADRTVWVQPLPLAAEQTQKVIDRLEHDILLEHRYYRYDHFWDNCTTRVRDVLDQATGGALSAMDMPAGEETFRDLAREGFFGMRIALLITDIAMGRVTDRVPTYYERMFLPAYMREAATERWGVEPVVVYERQGPPAGGDGPSGRVLLALLVLALTAPAWATRLWGRFERAGLAVAVIPPALLGLVFWALAIISPLPYVRYNETCLILVPFDLLLLILSPLKRRIYARARVAQLAMTGVLMLVGVLTQPLAALLLWPLIPAAVVAFWPLPNRP